MYARLFAKSEYDNSPNMTNGVRDLTKNISSTVTQKREKNIGVGFSPMGYRYIHKDIIERAHEKMNGFYEALYTYRFSSKKF